MTTIPAQNGSNMVAGLRTASQDGVLVVTLDRPPANALNSSLMQALTQLFQDHAGSAAPPLVITGSGERFFCAGGDIKELDGGVVDAVERMRLFHRMIVAIERYPAPVIAAVNGDCVGGGVECALFADAVLTVPSARFGFPEIRHGLLPADKGIQRLIRLIGMRSARNLLLKGELIDAREAARLGLVDAIIPRSQLMAEAFYQAREAGRRAPVLYAALKHAVNDYDDARDERQAEATLAKAASWLEDPVAKSLREGWGQRRKPLASVDAPQAAPNTTRPAHLAGLHNNRSDDHG